jgi:hypothetical protein
VWPAAETIPQAVVPAARAFQRHNSELAPFTPAGDVDPTAPIERIDLLGGLIHQYSRAA